MKRVLTILAVVCFVLTGCTKQQNDSMEEPEDSTVVSNEIEPIYRTEQEWKERFKLEEYHENEKLDSIPEGRPSAKCYNGTFVGNTIGGVDVYKGIPFAQAPIGQLRFKKAQPVLASNDIYDATYFGASSMQTPGDANELASQYEINEDSLKLNIWSSNNSSLEKKPVLVYIHGGGFVSGGTSDPLYDGWNFAYYNPDVIVVTITYRIGVLGYVDLSSFEGAEDYKQSANNASYDQIEALKWINQNIENFGGDKDNVTVCGESAGGCSVSILCLIPEARQYFNKAIPMSGAVNLCVKPEKGVALPAALKRDFNANSVADLQAIPFDTLQVWWTANMSTIYNYPVMDGKALYTDLFSCWENGDTKDLVILQGHTSTEFRYYYEVFYCYKDMYVEVCKKKVEQYRRNAKDIAKFDELYEKYKKAVMDLGFPEDEVEMCFADDMCLAISNTYQALQHSKNGGKGFTYTFNIPYDKKYNDFELGAAHAVDCYYLFGNFDGHASNGTKEEVDASIKFQKMIANFCKTGNPSIEGNEWPEYDTEKRKKMIIGLNSFEVVENPEKERVDAVLNILDCLESKYSGGLAENIAEIFEENPEIYQHVFELFMQTLQ